MSDNLNLAVSLRDPNQTLSQIRQADLIPAVLYGPAFDNQDLAVSTKTFKKIFAEAGHSTMVTLEVGQEKHPVIIREVQYHPVKNHVIHIDFYKVRMDQKIVANVPLEFTGTAPAVKDLGGVLVRNLDEVEVEALPQHMPSEITVDVSGLDNFEKVIHVQDLKLPQQAEVLNEGEEVVALVQPPRTETELESLNEAATENVEAVEQAKPEKKAEEEAAEAEEK